MVTKGTGAKSKPAGISEKVIRLLEVYTMIAREEYPSARRMMESFNVSERTVYRYLEIINFVDPVEYVKGRDGYKFVHGDRTKKLALSGEELLVLITAGKAVTHLGPSFREHFEDVLARMVSSPGPRGKKEEKVPILIRMADAVGVGTLNLVVSTAFRCASEKRSLEITYRAQHNKEITHRVVDPYGLIFHEGAWILVGYCHLRKGIRSFALDRVLDFKERYLYFTPMEGFELESYLSQSWGIYDDEAVSVTVEFSHEVSDYILRKDRWHPSEKREILPDGGVLLTFTVAGVDEIKRWIYSWLPHVKVIEPASLRETIRVELSRSAKNHS
jgi:predicted DNA-binding transcriptional regulator YafY